MAARLNFLLVFGHGAGDPGGVGQGTNERDFNRKVLYPYLKKWTDKSQHNFDYYDITGNKDMFQDTANGWGMYSISPSYYASVTEIHEDAAASSAATGGHNIVSSNFKADKEDLKLALVIKSVVDWWGSVKNTQGISYRNNLLNLNVAAQRGINYRLMELGFITNKSDMDKIKANLDAYAKGIVESITGEKFADVKPAAKPIQGIASPKMGLWYQAHVSDKGWLGYVGTEVTAGTTGQNRRLEALEVLWDKKPDSIRSSYHALNGKWIEVPKGVTGTTGKAQAIDQVCFASNAALLKTGRKIQYRVHSQDVGWSAWKEEGAVAGTKGKQIEAVQMRMVKNGKVEKG